MPLEDYITKPHIVVGSPEDQSAKIAQAYEEKNRSASLARIVTDKARIALARKSHVNSEAAAMSFWGEF